MRNGGFTTAGAQDDCTAPSTAKTITDLIRTGTDDLAADGIDRHAVVIGEKKWYAGYAVLSTVSADGVQYVNAYPTKLPSEFLDPLITGFATAAL